MKLHLDPELHFFMNQDPGGQFCADPIGPLFGTALIGSI